MTAQAVNTEGEPSTRLDDFAPIEGDVLSQVLGPEKNGSVRGLGFGVSPNMFKKSYADIVRENEQLKQEKLEVEGKYAMVMEKVDMLTELVKKCIDNSTLGQICVEIGMIHQALLSYKMFLCSTILSTYRIIFRISYPYYFMLVFRTLVLHVNS